MLNDLLLAAAHHLLVFALVAMLVAESVLLRGPLDGGVLQRLAKLDAGYGGCAGLLLAIGLGRAQTRIASGRRPARAGVGAAVSGGAAAD